MHHFTQTGNCHLGIVDHPTQLIVNIQVKSHSSAICLSAYLAVEGSDHYYLVTEPGNHSSIPPVTLIENMTYCFNEDLSAYIRLTNQED